MAKSKQKDIKNILIIGATSLIAEEVAKSFLESESKFFLVGRNENKLESLASDLKVRGAKDSFTYSLDCSNMKLQSSMINEAFNSLSSIDLCLIAYGNLTDQHRAENDSDYLHDEINTNFISYIHLLNLLAAKLEVQQSGRIAVITSVAGERGRAKNSIYGSSKAGLSTFLEGLRQKVSKSNISVLDIKPGFVDTPMTQSFEKGILWASPKHVAKDIYEAIVKNKVKIYTPYFWILIMSIIKLIPTKIFNKLKF